MNKTLVVYYSRSGKTEKAVQELKNCMECDVEVLVDAKNRKGLMGFITGGRDAVNERLTEIQQVKYEPAQYDRVVLCTPTWASNMVPAVRTYIEAHKKDFKQVAFLVTQGGGNNGKVYKSLEAAVGKAPMYKTNIGGREFRDGSWKEIVSGFAKEISK
ncbi:MAG: hypothetical protein Q8930_03225 [Bacillota bacterium]|nr:hypothetical protein [Bacillota bacterium]